MQNPPAPACSACQSRSQQPIPRSSRSCRLQSLRRTGNGSHYSARGIARVQNPSGRADALHRNAVPTCGSQPACLQRLAGMLAAGLVAMQPLTDVAAALAQMETLPKPAVPEAAREQQRVEPALPDAPPVELPPLPTTFPPLPDIKPLQIGQVTLPNGLRVFLAEDHELPLVRGTLLMRGGQRAVLPSVVGVATLSAAVQRSGGSTSLPGDQLDEALEQVAAYIEGGAGGEAVSMGFGCLPQDAPAVLHMFSDVVTSPALPQQKIDLYKGQLLNALSHLDDNAAAVPRRELGKLLYGRDSVFARNPTPAQVARIRRPDVVEYLETWERPDTSVLGVTGDFDVREMRRLVEASLGGWRVAEGQPATPAPVPNPPLPPHATAGQVLLVDRPGLTQASVAIGEPGVGLLDPDTAPLDVLTSVLNNFGGRLFNQIRSREGLAYSVGGGWNTSPVDHVGLFVAAAETAAPDKLLAALRTALQAARETAPAAEEMAAAQAETLNSFVFNFSSTAAQLQRQMVYQLIGLPADFLFQYKAAVEAVRPEDVLAAARRHLHPDAQTTVVIADAAAVRDSLEQANNGRTVELLALD